MTFQLLCRIASRCAYRVWYITKRDAVGIRGTQARSVAQLCNRPVGCEMGFAAHFLMLWKGGCEVESGECEQWRRSAKCGWSVERELWNVA